jgi:hypothetical protein
MDPRPWDGGWRWWLRMGAIWFAVLVAAVVISFGAYRYLVLADRQRDRTECVQRLVGDQARTTADMAAVVLDARLSVEQRRTAVATWSNAQRSVADRIGRC